MVVDFQQSSTTQSAIADAGVSFDAAYARAREHANGGQPELALAEYSVLLARSPGNADVLLGRGVVLAPGALERGRSRPDRRSAGCARLSGRVGGAGQYHVRVQFD